jgi:hypothetical protein
MPDVNRATGQRSSWVDAAPTLHQKRARPDLPNLAKWVRRLTHRLKMCHQPAQMLLNPPEKRPLFVRTSALEITHQQ